jgi:tape measure domain-containing protein
MADELTIRAHLINEVSGPAREARADIRELTAETKVANAVEATATSSHRKHADSVQALHQRILGLSSSLGGQLATGLKLATVGIAGLGGAAALFGLKAASSFQSTRVAFDTMLGSVEAGGALFKQLQQINLKSPFELSQLTQATQVLLRYGVAADQVVGVTQGIANAAALSGPRMVENLDKISLALGQVQAKGKLQGEEARQLAEAGINAYGVYERQLGLTRDQVEKLGEAGKLSGNILLDAVAKGDLGIQGLDTAAAKLAGTLQGQFSNLKDLLNVGLADAAQPLAAQLGTLIGSPDQPGSLVSGLQALITNVGPPLFTLVGDLADLLTSALPTLGPILTAIVGGVGELLAAGRPALQALAPVSDKLAASLGGLVTALVPVMPDLVRAFVALVAVLPTFVDLLADLVPLVAPILRLIDGFLELGPVNHALAVLLGGLLAYRAVSGVVTVLQNMRGAILGVAGAEREEAAARGLGGSAGAIGVAGGLVAGGALLLSGSKSAAKHGPTLGSDLQTVGGTAVLGATIGSVVPGVGTAIGAGAGAAGGLIAVGIEHLIGDTPTIKALANTLAAHRFASAMSGGGQRITNTTGARYAGSDHVAGKAVDVTGANLFGYAQVVRAAGGYADFHGQHLHAVMGDTPSPRSSSAASSRRAGATLLVDVHDNVISSDVDLERAISRGIAKNERDRKERG